MAAFTDSILTCGNFTYSASINPNWPSVISYNALTRTFNVYALSSDEVDEKTYYITITGELPNNYGFSSVTFNLTIAQCVLISLNSFQTFYS